MGLRKSLEIEMSEDELREQFETWWISGEVKLPVLVSEHSMFFADQAWLACAKIKDAECLEKLKEEGLAANYFEDEMLKGKAEIEELKDRLFEIQNAAIELSAKIAMMHEAVDELCSHEPDFLRVEILVNPSEQAVTKFLNGVRAARDAEWMAGLVGYVNPAVINLLSNKWSSTTTITPNVAFDTDVALYIQPKEMK
jgi:hypothetical protein